MNIKTKRIMAFVIAVTMALSIIPYRGVNTYAFENTENVKADGEETDIATPTDPINTFDRIYSEVDTTCLDFSGCELLMVPKSEGVITEDTEIISEVGGVYLLRFESEEETRFAYTYYFDKAEIIEVNETITGCESDEGEPTEGTDQEDIEETGITEGRDEYIALIDTGADGNNVTKQISVIGDVVSDDNGHGSKMAAAIAAVNPLVRILSIKALDSSNRGKLADIYEAIESAISENVSIINLSVSSLVSTESDIIQKAVKDATDAGIYVVAAAGNKGASASYYTPGNIPEAFTIGACDKNGNRVSISNYGSCVDYYTEADTTSVAAARFTGYLSIYGINGIENNKDVYTREKVETEEKEPGVIIDSEPIDTASDTDAVPDEKLDEKPVKGAMEGTMAITNGSDGLNYLTVTRISGDNYKYSIGTNHGTFYAYCIDPSLINPDNEANYTFKQQPLESSGIAYKRELTTALWYGLHYSKSGIQSYNDFIKSIGYYSSENDLYNQTHYTAAYAAGGVGYSRTAYHAKDTYDRMMSWIEKADPNKDGKFYVDTDGNEGDAGSDTEKKFYAGNGYRVYFDYKGEDVNNLSFAFASESNDNDEASYNVKVKTEETKSDSVYGSGQITEWIHLIPQNKKPSSDIWANISTRVPVPSKGKIFVDENGNGKIDKTYTSGSAVIWGNSKFKIWINDKASKGRYTSGSCLNSTIFAQTWVAYTSNSKAQRLAYLYIPQCSSMLNFFWNGYVPVERYVAIQKIDANTGNPINGVTFVLSHNGDKEKYASNYDSSAQIKIGNDTIKGYASAVTRTVKVGNKEYKGVAIFKFIDLPENKEYGFRFLEASAPKPYRNIEGNLSKSATDFKEISPDGSKTFILSTYGEDNTDRSAAIINALKYKVRNYKPTYVKLNKSSSNTSITSGNPNYSLAGATYRLYRTRNDADSNANSIHEFVVNADGVAEEWPIPVAYMNKNEDGTLKNTEFYYKEVKAGKNYKLNKSVGSVVVAASNLQGSPASIKVQDEPVLANVECMIIKKDKLSGLSLSEGDSSLAGTSFTVKYYVDDISVIRRKQDFATKTPTKTFNIKTAWNEEKKAYVAKVQDKLPLGYITIEETGAPKNYKIQNYKAVINNSNKEYEITGRETFVLKSKGSAGTGYEDGTAYWIEDDGKAARNIAMTYQGEISFMDTPVRADLHIKKQDKDGNALEGFKFKILNTSNGEFHYIYTDENGEYHSSANKNPRTSESINAADTNDYEKGNKYPLWFENTENSEKKIPYSNEYGALLPGNYEVTEVRGGLNKDPKGYQLEPVMRFVVDGKTDGADISISYNGAGTVIDSPAIGFGTTALCMETNSAMAPQNTEISISDICSFTSLRADTDYTIVGTVMVRDISTGELSEYKDSEGNNRRTIKSFKTGNEWNGTIYSIDQEEEVLFKKVDTTDLSGKDILIYEVLYLGIVTEADLNDEDTEYNQYEDGEKEITFPIRHENPEDESQTIHIPRIATTANTSEGKEIEAGEKVVIVDSVMYSNLLPDTYTIKGKLMNKYTGEEIYIDEKALESQVTFTIEDIEESNKNMRGARNGLVDVSFEADMSKLFKEDSDISNLDVVVFEELYVGEGKPGDRKVAEHKDIEDTDQTVTIKKKEKITTEETTEVTTEITTETTTETITAGTTRETTEVTTQITTEVTIEKPKEKVFSKKKEETPKTGDEVSIVLAVMISLISLVVGLLILYKKRMNKEEE
ncbi:MAG: VaFE repeat-containing surface-anchored protein [Eubacterium sp.]|nr:VaFE repeat-containing surface-anchored protein [Eubacterium sp.]